MKVVRRAARATLAVVVLSGAGCSSSEEAGSGGPLPDASFDGAPESEAQFDVADRGEVESSLPDADAASDADAATDAHAPPPSLTLTPLFPTTSEPGATLSGCMFASPIAYEGSAGTRILVADASGTVAALDPIHGNIDWQLALPAPPGEHSFVVPTPVLVGARLVVAYHTVSVFAGAGPNVNDPRVRHRVVVVDLETRSLDPAFPVVDLTASVTDFAARPVSFLPSNALARGALVHGVGPGELLGRVYVTFGNVRDIQPYHGWIFEVSLDDWREQGEKGAIRSSLTVTPDADCGQVGSSGSRDHVCGGGLWAPWGPLLVPKETTYELILAPDNGRLDIPRHEYARTLMRVGPGLAFDDGCDPSACQAWNENAPAEACTASCSNLFVPRTMPGDPPLVPESGICDGITNMFECWYKLDYPGGSTPVRVDVPGGPAVLVYPNKDGHVFLVDAEHLGTLYDRKQVVSFCGTRSDPCQADWGGMIVTQPAVAEVDGAPAVLIPTFMPDNTHAAGVVALAIRLENGTPKLSRLWQSPSFDTEEARKSFRRAPTRVTVASAFGDDYGWVVDVAPPGKIGTLLGMRTRDGSVAAKTALAGPGFRFSAPLVHDGVIYVNSCTTDIGPSGLEAYRIDPAPSSE
jgi:hypothetical protein